MLMNVRPAEVDRSTVHVGFMLFPGFAMSELALFLDTLHIVNRDEPGAFSWELLARDRELVRTNTGLELLVSRKLGSPSRFRYLVFIGGGVDLHVDHDRELGAFIRAARSADVGLVGISSGSMALAAAGALKGSRACVSWEHTSEFQDNFVDVTATSAALFIEDNGAMTCAGGVSVADMVLHLVDKHRGREVRRKVMERLHMERCRDGHEAQSRLPRHFPECVDDLVRRVLQSMEQNLDDTLSIRALASSVGVSPRQLERRFNTSLGVPPERAYKSIRMSKALTLVTSTEMPIREIALEVGLQSASHFGKKFKGHFGFTAMHARRQAMRKA